MGDAGDHPCARVLVAVPFCGWSVTFGAQVVWPQEKEFRSRAEWRVLFVLRENKKARLLQGGADYS